MAKAQTKETVLTEEQSVSQPTETVGIVLEGDSLLPEVTTEVTLETLAEPTVDLTNGFFDGVKPGTTHELPNGISVTHY